MTTEIFDATVRVAKRVGYRNVTRALLADESGVSYTWLVNNFRMRETLLKIAEDATALGVEPGERNRKFSNLWAGHDKRLLTETARKLAGNEGLAAVTRARVAKLSGFSRTTITKYFGGDQGLVDAVLQQAIDAEDAVVVMQGLAICSPIARTAPEKLRRAALKTLDAD